MAPEAFVHFASQLTVRPTAGPAAFRSAVSRAYYGAYHRARQLLEALGIRCTTGKSNEHMYLQRLLQGSSVAEAVEVGRLLGNLLENRRDADYELAEASAETIGLAKACSERAHDLLVLIAQCEQPTLAAAIKQGVLAYKGRTNDP